MYHITGNRSCILSCGYGISFLLWSRDNAVDLSLQRSAKNLLTLSAVQRDSDTHGSESSQCYHVPDDAYVNLGRLGRSTMPFAASNLTALSLLNNRISEDPFPPMIID